MKNQKAKFLKILLFLAFITIYELRFTNYEPYAQDNNKLVILSKQIIESKNNEGLYAFFEELKDSYFQENKYSELVKFLESLSQQKNTLEPFVNYYTALARYYQLKHLEKTQDWDEYFSQGKNYRDQITTSIQKTLDSTNAKDALNIYSRLLLWQFHKDQEDAFVESGLTDLMNAISGYAKDTQDMKPIKEAADKLLSYGERGKSKELYQIYVHKLIGSVKEDKELESIALGFYKEASLELSETVYDVYIERITKTYPKEKLIPILINIARNFSYSALGGKDEGPKDASYAEKIFKKIEETGTKDAFAEELTYLRAFNAEKMKDYPKAGDLYLDLLQRYPQTNYTDEAGFKVGIISTYILRDIKTGRDYFEKLAQEETLSPQVISSLYQLGLLSQWENDLVTAKDYYNKLVEKAGPVRNTESLGGENKISNGAGNDFIETVTLAKQRLKEITKSKPIEYNLKTFLDVSLKVENPAFETARVDLNSSRYRRIKKDESTNISCTPYNVESGCMQVEIQYLWSGDLGTAKPPLEKSEFNTTYAQPGTKVINLAIVSPSGILDRSIEIVDVY